MCDIWKNWSWSTVDARTSFFLILSQFDLFFPEKVIKIGVFAHFSPIYKSRSNFGVVKSGSWVLVDAHRFFFMGHELEHAREALEMCQNTLAYLRK